MSTSPEFAESQNTYVIDAESASEMARLLDQDKLITEQCPFPRDECTQTSRLSRRVF